MPSTNLYYTAMAAIAAASLTSTTVHGQENFCGKSWVDAVGSCALDCPSGAPTDCGAGETCFAGTPCVKAQLQTPPPTPRPIVPPVQQQQQQVATTNTVTGTCGEGQRGNGQCPITTECCSQYGHCGTTSAHCAPAVVVAPAVAVTTNANAAPATGGSAPSVFGTCGGGQPGNGICPNNSECCSAFGFCGVTADHCNNKVGNLGPPGQQPTTSQQTQTGQQTAGNTPQYNQQGILVPARPPQQQLQAQHAQSSPQQFGTCGNGQTGNGICMTNSQCCSKQGFCGNTLEHCMDKVGPSFPGQEVQQDQAGNNQYGGQQQQVQQQPQVQQQQPGQQGQTQFGNGRPNGDINMNGQQPNMNNNQQQQTTTQQQQQTTTPHGTSKKIIGYYAGWQWYDRDKLATPSNLDFSKLQRVNYAFFQPDALGNIYGTDSWGDPQLLFGPYSTKFGGGVQKCSYDGPGVVNCAYHEMNSGLIYRAHGSGAEVYPSIGGWTLSDNFPTLSANPASRDAFAKNCVEILTHHDFDGIDIDWEYPGYAEHSGTPADKENFTKMLAAIQAALETLTRSTGKVYGLTAALPCSPTNIANIEVAKLTSILTEFNLMSYDFHGAWDSTTGMNAPLYYQGYGDEEFNIHRCVENYVALGVPRERINIGLPFYGRSFKYASKLNQTHGGNDVANWPDDDGTPQYFQVHSKLPHMIQMRDNKSKTQYAYISHSEQPPGGLNNPDGLAQSLPEGLISFDDERAICDKVHYAQEKSLGGFIIWELSGDLLEDLRTPLLDITNRKLADPSLKCCMLHSADECEKEELYNQQQQQLNAQTGGFDSAQWASPNSRGSRKGEGHGSLVLALSLAMFATTTSVLFW